MIRPTGTSHKAQWAQAVYDQLMRDQARHSLGFLTSRTTRGVFRTPVFPVERRPETGGEFDVTWNLRSGALGSFGNAGIFSDVPIVTGGIAFAATIQERELMAAGNLTGALAAPNTGEANSYRLAQSRLFDPATSRLRFRFTATPAAETHTGIFGTATPYLYVRLFEMPFSATQRPAGGTEEEQLDKTKGFKPVSVTYIPSESSPGFHVYGFTGQNILITPDARVRAVVESSNGNLIKPRATWGDTWLAYSLFGNGKIILSEQTTQPLVFTSAYHRATFGDLTGVLWEYTAAGGPVARNRFPSTMAMSGEEYHQPPSDGINDVYEVNITSQPVDGNSIRVTFTNPAAVIQESHRIAIWRNTVSDATTEIQIGADLQESQNNFEGFLSMAGVHAFSTAVRARISASRWQLIYGGLGSFIDGTTFDSVSNPPFTYTVLPDEPTTFLYPKYTPTIQNGSFGTIAKVAEINHETMWRPADNAFNKPTISGGNIDSCYRFDWLAIPLTGSYDSVISLPRFSKPFVVQAFFGKYLQLTANPEDHRAFAFSLNVRPA